MKEFNDILKFTKMEGAGNDYIYVDATGMNDRDIDRVAKLASKLSDRHFGIGSDGLVLICRSDIADFRMRMFNSDGSESEMCGNATRCIGKFVYDKKMTDKTSVSLETKAGIKIIDLHIGDDGLVYSATVDMGEPVLNPSLIPVRTEGEKAIGIDIITDSGTYKATCVSMGNPHAVIFTKDVKDLDLEHIGPKIEHNGLFPNRTNTEFAEVKSRTHVEMRTWERGAGETLACGTGTCAMVVAAILNGMTERDVDVDLIGGRLHIKWDEKTNHVFMTGPAATVFEGEIHI